MAETVHLYLKANNTDIKGESTQESLGRKDSIECLSFTTDVITAREKGSALATGRRQYNPLFIRKRVDKSTPLLIKALCENQRIDAEFKFFRPNPTGDGTTEQFFTVAIANGRIDTHKIVNPDTFLPASANQPLMEEVTFVFHTISWTYTNGGVTHEDTWNQQR